MLQWGRDLLVAESRAVLRELMGQEHASMGPRLVSRGKLGIRRANIPVEKLQWGRDLLVAESDRDCREHVCHATLQWGRDLLVAERPRRRIKEPCRLVASMGPRLVSRGKQSRQPT